MTPCPKSVDGEHEGEWKSRSQVAWIYERTCTKCGTLQNVKRSNPMLSYAFSIIHIDESPIPTTPPYFAAGK